MNESDRIDAQSGAARKDAARQALGALAKAASATMSANAKAARPLAYAMFAIGLLLIVVFGGKLAVDTIGATGTAQESTGQHDASGGQASPGRLALARKPELKLSLRIDEGWLLTHDLHLTNTSGKDLTEARLTVQVVGENAAPTLERFWASWSLGQTQLITVPVDDVKNIQRVTVTGSADQGKFDLTFTADE